MRKLSDSCGRVLYPVGVHSCKKVPLLIDVGMMNGETVQRIARLHYLGKDELVQVFKPVVLV
jgi:hypothetical protein